MLGGSTGCHSQLDLIPAYVPNRLLWMTVPDFIVSAEFLRVFPLSRCAARYPRGGGNGLGLVASVDSDRFVFAVRV